jgi:hypothetical protein
LLVKRVTRQKFTVSAYPNIRAGRNPSALASRVTPNPRVLDWYRSKAAKAGFFDKLRPTLKILTRRGGKGDEQSHFEEIVQLLALMKDTDIHEMRQILERRIMENLALRG